MYEVGDNPGCHCGRPWGSVLPPPPCPHHQAFAPTWERDVHQLERLLLRRLLEKSYVALSETGWRLYFDADWLELSPALAALLQSLEAS